MQGTSVSIVVPTYQQGRFLRTCLESLVTQNHPELEVLVHDNLSSDETAELLAEFGPRLASVRRERDAGQADALRRGFARARGEIFGWLNGDDMLMPDAVRCVARAFESDPTLDVVSGHCAFLDEDGQFLRYFAEAGPFEREELDYSDPLAQASTFFRRRAYEAVGGIDPGLRYTMDWDLWRRFAGAGCRFRFVEEVLSGVRLHPSAKTSRGGLGRWLEISRVNLRHTTRRLPMLPVLRVAALLQEPLARASPLLHSVARRAWRRALTPMPRRARSEAAAGNGRATTLAFPVHGWTRAVEARLDFAGAAAPSREAVEWRLNGWSAPTVTRNGSSLHAFWHGEPTFVAALRVSARVAEGLGGGPPRLTCRYERAAPNR